MEVPLALRFPKILTKRKVKRAAVAVQRYNTRVDDKHAHVILTRILAVVIVQFA
jgi:hypothetical protein